MVRRRSTVRFRKGAPGRKINSNALKILGSHSGSQVARGLAKSQSVRCRTSSTGRGCRLARRALPFPPPRTSIWSADHSVARCFASRWQRFDPRSAASGTSLALSPAPDCGVPDGYSCFSGARGKSGPWSCQSDSSMACRSPACPGRLCVCTSCRAGKPRRLAVDCLPCRRVVAAIAWGSISNPGCGRFRPRVSRGLARGHSLST
jgi:hypothetical protein